jgi:GT2 family glycosyltransferase
MTAPKPTVSIIVLTFQSERTVRGCLASIAAHAGPNAEVIVVDNASIDGTLDVVREVAPEAHIIALTENRGFAAGMNAGIAHASADTFLLLNPDAELTPTTLPPLMRSLASDPTIAAVGPRLTYPDGTPQDSAFTYPTLLMTWLEFFPHPGRLLHTRLNGRLTSSDGQPIEIDHPLGACMLISRSAWLDVGPMDVQFFLYCEEVDWCMRARAHGWRILHVPAAVAIHEGGASSSLAPAVSLLYLYVSRRYLHRKHRRHLFRRLAGAITWLGLRRERKRLAARLDPNEPSTAPFLDALRRAARVSLR